MFATAAYAFIGVGGLLAAWPFIAQLGPHAGTPLPEVTDVDLIDIKPGQTKVVRWRNLPVIVRRRTVREIELSRAVPLDTLRDRLARNDALPADAPATDANRTSNDRPDWLVMLGYNPRSGCILRSMETPPSTAADEMYICPCDASRFDAVGRVLRGPAETNLLVPPYRFITPGMIRIG